jgi:hypothetical protein
MSGSVGETVAALSAARAKLDRKRDRLVAAIADGVLEHSDAAAQLSQIRDEIAQVERRMEASRFRGRRARGVGDEREPLLQAIADFPALVKRLRGPDLRALVEPWIAHASFDKVTRELVLGIQPAGGIDLLSRNSVDPADRKHVAPLIRRVSLAHVARNRRRA